MQDVIRYDGEGILILIILAIVYQRIQLTTADQWRAGIISSQVQQRLKRGLVLHSYSNTDKRKSQLKKYYN